MPSTNQHLFWTGKMLFLSLITVSLLAVGSCQNPDSIKDWNSPGRYHESPSSSSASFKRSQANQPTFDYTKGFPSDFSHGLPTFDFDKTSGATGKDDHKSAETESVGFFQGPPNGFPNLEQLGGSFPNFDESAEQSPVIAASSPYKSANYAFQTQESAPPSSGSYSRHPPSSTGSSSSSEEEYFGPPGMSHRPERYEPRPFASASSHHDEPQDGPPAPYPRGPLGVSRPRGQPPPPPSYPHSGSYQPFPEGPSPPHQPRPSSLEPERSPSSHEIRPPTKYHSKKPVVLKMSNKNHKYRDYLPPGPPVFFAPSPDVQQQQQQQQHQQSSQSHEDIYGAGSQKIIRPSKQDLPAPHPRFRRALPAEQEAHHDLKASASEPDTFWELTSSPFLVFDTYKDEPQDDHHHRRHPARAPQQHHHLRSSNISFVDTDGGEQRFFPSFPAPAPYLIGGPFGQGPSSRPPLFPGPAANRAPSRYHPNFGPGPKYSPPAPVPQRAPTRQQHSIYSAESHDHYQDNNLLGSGNFEVVRGGTYYADEDDGYHGHGGGGGGGHHGSHFDHDDDYYPGNGHSAPEGYRIPGHHGGHGGGGGNDFFANFRDFADINPPSRSFSHRHEAVALPDSDSRHKIRKPKNILDKLESSATDAGSSYSPVPHPSTISEERGEYDPMMASS